MFISHDLRAVYCFYCRVNYVVMAIDIIIQFLLREAWAQPPNLVNLSGAENFRSASLSSGDYVRHKNRSLLVISYLLLLAPLSHMCWTTGGNQAHKVLQILTLSGPGGGAQRPGWPNSQLPIRNLLSYDAQTWWLLVFILKTPFGHILAKLVHQGGCCCSFLIETSQKFWKWKIFPMLENCWNWHGGSILGREERFWT